MDVWVALFISSGGFTGFLPGLLSRGRVGWGGLMGSLVGVLLQYRIMYYETSLSPTCNKFETQLWFIAAIFWLGMISVVEAEEMMLRKWGWRKRHNGEWVDHDFNETCVDEVVGQMFAGLVVYLFAEGASQVIALGISFILFRIFDAKKIGPVRWAEDKFTGAAGIMLDDVVAGIMAAVATIPVAIILECLAELVWPYVR